MGTQTGTVITPVVADAVYDNHSRVGYLVAENYVAGRTAALAEDESVIEVTQNTARTISKRIYNSADGQPLTLAASDATAAVIQLKKIGGNFATITPTLNRRGTYLDLDLTSGNLDTVGDADVTITIPGAIPASVKLSVIKLDKNDNVRAGLTALPAAEPLNAGGLLTFGTGTGQINAAGGRADADVKYFGGTLAPAPTVAGIPKVEDATVRTGISDVQSRLPASLTGFGYMKSEIDAIAGTTVGYPFSVTGVPTAGDVADAVWDELRNDHGTSGTFGEGINATSLSDAVITEAAITEVVKRKLFGRILDTTATVDNAGPGGTGRVTFLDPTCAVGDTSYWNGLTVRAYAGTGLLPEYTATTPAVDTENMIVSWVSGLTYICRKPWPPGILSDGTDPADCRVLLGAFSGELETESFSVTDNAAIADAVWDEPQVDHASAGTFGLTLAGLAASTATAVWDFVVEGTHTARHYMRGYASALLYKAAGFAGTTRTYRDAADTKNRITATVDSSGRPAVSHDFT